jgi:hypothetical protein
MENKIKPAAEGFALSLLVAIGLSLAFLLLLFH